MLDALRAALDPVDVLRDIHAAQRALVETADTVPVVPVAAPSIGAFLEGLKVAWRSTKDVRPTPSKPDTEPCRTRWKR